VPSLRVSYTAKQNEEALVSSRLLSAARVSCQSDSAMRETLQRVLTASSP
jgi:hypothetical protein